MNILGLKIVSHDTGAALISDKRIVAIAEERLSRVKHSFNMFPELSIRYCMDHFGLTEKDIDLVVIDQTDLRSVIETEKIFHEKTSGAFRSVKVLVINHHLAHAASAFYASPYESSAILVSDGAGEKFETNLGTYGTETETYYRGEGNTIEELRKTLHLREGKIFPYTFGIGKLYSFFSDRYIGFGPYNEGKMMGLAPYGNDSFLKQFPVDHFMKEWNGTYVCNSRIGYPASISSGQFSFGRIFYGAYFKLRMFLRGILVKASRAIYGSRLFDPEIFEKVQLPKPKRQKSDTLPDAYYTNVAFAAQTIFERFTVAIGRQLKRMSGENVLCVAGGCGLNIDANMKFVTDCGYDDVFIQPACSDTGIALGCALYGLHGVHNEPRFFKMENAYLGKPYSEDAIRTALNKFSDQVNFHKSPNSAEEAAQFLSESKIIGWFQGGSEYGPRALGSRSMIADARHKDMRDILNNRVKHRESWRPFAASVLKERSEEYFDLDRESPFMLLAANVKTEKRNDIPSVVHVDGTCRVQTVTKEANGRYHDLIEAFYRKTGVPLVLNTSFNLGGDPIVETPEDALDTFTKTDFDYLVLEDYIVEKKH